MYPTDVMIPRQSHRSDYFRVFGRLQKRLAAHVTMEEIQEYWGTAVTLGREVDAETAA
jgi:hypothetical protein